VSAAEEERGEDGEDLRGGCRQLGQGRPSMVQRTFSC
jgi:hypothetical protein